MFYSALICLLTVSLSTDTFEVRTTEGEEAAHITLVSHEPIHFRTAPDGRELLIRFDRPIEISAAERLPQQLPLWIEAVTLGFDTILIRAARNANYSVRENGSEIAIDITPEISPAPRPAREYETAQARISLLQARLWMNTGRVREGFDLLERLHREDPDNVSVMVTLADEELRFNRWRRAQKLYSRALAVSPRNEDVLDRQRIIQRDHTPRFVADMDYKSVRDAQRERILRLSEDVQVTDSTRLGFAYEGNAVRFKDFEGYRQRGEVYWQYDREEGPSTRASLLTGRDTIGVGLHHARPDHHGRTDLRVDYGRAYWEYVETLIGGGVRDRIELQREQILRRGLVARLSSAFNRYRFKSERNAARSLGFAGSLAYAFVQAPYLGVEYGYDGEYRRSFKTASALPLVSHEFHTLGLVFIDKPSRRLRKEGYGGFSWDRLGGRGPYLGAKVSLNVSKNLELQGWFDRRLNMVATGQVVNRMGGSLLWRWRQ